MILRRYLSLDSITKPSAFVSKSTCPYFNLALEDWLFRKTPADVPLLLLYRNRASVIIGRNQNPWKEINLEAMQRRSVSFVRRRSGGGTVYHDLGNTNYSVMVPRASFQRRPNAELVARAVKSLGPPAEVNERNDIVVEGFKVSGSAYKIINKRAYHHGTMLIDAKLDELGDILHNTKENLVTKGVESVRSPVKNLTHWTPGLTHEAFCAAVAEEFRKTYGAAPEPLEIDEAILNQVEDVRSGYEELQTWDWQYGQTPEFTHILSKAFNWGDMKANITSKKGKITSLTLDYSPPLISDDLHEYADGVISSLLGDLYNQKYGLPDHQPTTGPMADHGARMRSDIIAWLQQEM